MTLAIAIIGLVLAVYGAIGSTYLAVLRSREMKRNVRIFVQHLDYGLPVLLCCDRQYEQEANPLGIGSI